MHCSNTNFRKVECPLRVYAIDTIMIAQMVPPKNRGWCQRFLPCYALSDTKVYLSQVEFQARDALTDVSIHYGSTNDKPLASLK